MHIYWSINSGLEGCVRDVKCLSFLLDHMHMLICHALIHLLTTRIPNITLLFDTNTQSFTHHCNND